MRGRAGVALAIALAVTALAAVPSSDVPAAAKARGQQRLLIATTRGDELILSLIRPDGSDRHRIYKGTPPRPEFSPDGRWIVFMHDGNVVILRSDGSRLRRVFNPPGRPSPTFFDPTFSPSGRRIIFGHDRDKLDEYTHFDSIRLDGTGRRSSTRLRGTSSDPDFSSDGRSVVYERDFSVYIARRNGRGERNLSQLGDDEYSWQAQFSPNGRRVVFTSLIRDVPQIFVVRRDGSRRRALTHHFAGQSFWPIWSPDSRRIAFSRTVGPKGDRRGVVMVMNADGSHAHRITPFRGDNYMVDWAVIPPGALP